MVLAILLAVPAVGAQADDDSDSTVDPPRTVFARTADDVPDDHRFAAEIRALILSGITLGCNPPENSQFCPDGVVTRGQMAAFLARALGLQVPDAPAGFEDTIGSVFAADIDALAAAGVTKGCNPPANTMFCPGSAVRRDHMAAFLVRALDLPIPEKAAGFADTEDSPHREEIDALAAAGVTKGCNPPANTRFCPEQSVTRAQLAAFLVRALGLEGAPKAPDSLAFDSSGIVDEADPYFVASGLGVCDIGTGGPVEVRNVSSELRSMIEGLAVADVTITGATVEGDVWRMELAEDECRSLQAAWDPFALTVRSPLEPVIVNSHFGPRRHPIFGYVRLHAGVDLDGDVGQPIASAADGVVVRAEYFGGYGNTVDVQHVSGVLTRYAHLSSFDVEVGDVVAAGDPLGGVGCTGLCTGPHLHFETRILDEPIDPLTFMAVKPVVKIDDIEDPLGFFGLP